MTDLLLLLAYSCCLILLKLLSPVGKFFIRAWRTIKLMIFKSWLLCKNCCQDVMAGMRLSRLRFASNTLMGVLAAVTIYSLLLRSGNVESNPGPGGIVLIYSCCSVQVADIKNYALCFPDLDYNDVDAAQILGMFIV